jgi:hypothetical protein
MTVDELIVRLRCASDAGHGSEPVLLGAPDSPLLPVERIEFVLDESVVDGVWSDAVLLRGAP